MKIIMHRISQRSIRPRSIQFLLSRVLILSNLCILGGLGSFWIVGDFCADAIAQDTNWELPSALQYSTEVRSEPRPLRIHRLSIDLQDKSLEFAAVPGRDPDGDGPIEAMLTPPTILGEEASAIALINTNAWGMFPDKETGKKQGYVVGGEADILGWVSQGETRISPVQAGYWSCWMSHDRKVSIANLGEKPSSEHPGSVVWSISGFRGILMGGAVLPEPSDVRHPRTALGLSAEGTRMIWLVVDGRQRGYSEGVSEYELAQLMLEAGCSDAMNLDGGGSSVMLLRDKAGALTAANRPSDPSGQRPVPVVLCIRRSEQSN